MYTQTLTLGLPDIEMMQLSVLLLHRNVTIRESERKPRLICES